MIISIHLGLAITLFLIQNWIGSRAYSKGYIRFSLLDDKDEALAINYVIKVFSPIVFLIIVVAAFQYFRLFNLTENIINVIYFYLGIRLSLIFLYERDEIVNWLRILFYYTSILIISNYIYSNFINSVNTLLPDFTEIKNEIWLLIIFFIYQIGNGLDDNSSKEPLETSRAYLPELKNRKRKYILNHYKEFKSKFHDLINQISKNDEPFNLVIYSILIFENFNRPRIIRWVERWWLKITKKPTSIGIMQTTTNLPLSDRESIVKGTTFLFERYSDFKVQEDYQSYLFRRTIKRHCPDKKYIRQILFIGKAIIDNEYKDIQNKEGIEKTYSKLYDEIKSEFELYDYFD